jgi:hypothetical protein
MSRETDEEYWERLAAEEAEQARLASRSMWMKIHDAQDIHDLKDVLHELILKLEIE